MQRIPKVSRADVERIVRRDFPKEKHDAVLRMLDEYGAESHENEPHRVHAAVLKLSGGDADKVRENVDLAKRDFRDAIAAAEYPKYLSVSFAKVSKMPREEVEKIEEDDWKQYDAWFRAE